LRRQKLHKNCCFVLGELVNLAAGLGFNGYDESGNAKWDLINNADILTIEVSSTASISK
jgi:lysophospholipid acyltransferase 1/2